MTPIRVKMKNDGFIEGKRVRKGQSLFVYQPHMVSFRSMELFNEKDVDVVKKAQADNIKRRKTRPKNAAVVKPQIVQKEKPPEPIEKVAIDPDTGIPVNVSTVVGEDGKPAKPLPGQPAAPIMAPQETVI
jgi:hypothetical protein